MSIAIFTPACYFFSSLYIYASHARYVLEFITTAICIIGNNGHAYQMAYRWTHLFKQFSSLTHEETGLSRMKKLILVSSLVRPQLGWSSNILIYGTIFNPNIALFYIL